MIRLIYGSKGSGKTGMIIDEANTLSKECDGELVFLTDSDKYKFKINYNVRLINVTEYDIASGTELSGFIRGIIAGNADISHIYIDGVHRMTQMTFDAMGDFFAELNKIAADHDVVLVLTISAGELPSYMDAYEKVHA